MVENVMGEYRSTRDAEIFLFRKKALATLMLQQVQGLQ